jgi:hypothetical protein
MKEIFKKVKTLKGAILTVEDVHGIMEEAECYFDNGIFMILDTHKVTVKVKGKAVENKDVTISFEEN